MTKSLPAVRYSGALGLLAVTAGVVSAKPPAPGFWLTGLAPNATYGWVTCLTQDGHTAGGFSAASSPVIFAAGFTWSKAGGRSDFGLLAGMPSYSPAYGLSDTGVVVGVMYSSGKTRAYRWTGRGALQDLGVLPGETRSYASGISSDGNVVVGHSEHGSMSPIGQAFRWTPAKGMEGIGKLTPSSIISMAHAVSRDGKTIVGENWNEFLNTDAFVWTEGGGMKVLPKLGNPWNTATADAVNADGSVIVGRSILATGGMHMVRWENGVVEDLGAGLTNAVSWGLAVSDNGEVVGGLYNAGGTSDTALVWTKAMGAINLVDYLALHGVSVPNDYKPEDVYAVSGDGLTFGGQARNLTTGIREGFVATVPGKTCMADCDASGSLDIDDFICFQTRFAISDPYADCDASGQLDIEDFICFQTYFAIGC